MLPYSQKLFETTVPVEWTPQSQLFAVVPVLPDSKEGQQVFSLVQETLVTAQLISLHRIQNVWLWSRCSHCRDLMLLKSRESATEKNLFHGTSSTPPIQVYLSRFSYSTMGYWGVLCHNRKALEHICIYSTKYRLTGASCDRPQDSTLTRPPPQPMGAMPVVDSHVGLYISLY